MNKNRKVLYYRIRKQLHGRYKIEEFYQVGDFVRKRTLYKDLLHNEAEDLVYRLEKGSKK